MRKIQVYVWWSSGLGDGDGYYEEIEVTEEQYDIFKELRCSGEDLNLIKDTRIVDYCQNQYKELINALFENSKDYEEESYREDCLIDQESDEYDLNGDEEQFTETIEEWWFNKYNVGVRIKEYFDDDNDEKIE